MAKKAFWVSSLLLLLFSAWGGLGLRGQEEQPARFQLLIVDETTSFTASMGVELFARALKRTGLFDLSARIADVDSSFADPLRGQEPDRRYDIIIIVPRGIEDDTVRQIWIVTRPFHEISEGLRSTVALIKEIVNSGSQGRLTAVDITDDGIPGIFATLFIREGWL